MLSGILYPTSGQATVLGYVPWERKRIQDAVLDRDGAEIAVVVGFTGERIVVPEQMHL